MRATVRGLSTKDILQEMEKGWDPKRHRVQLFSLQSGRDLYTQAPITPGSFFIGGSVGHVDHRLEQQLVVTALQRATHWNVFRGLIRFAVEAVEPADCRNFALVSGSVNCSKGAVFQTAMSNAGGSTLDALFPLATYAHPGTKCHPWLRPIAVAVLEARDPVVAYFQEHGPGTRIGSLSGYIANELEALVAALRLEDIIEGQTDVRQTRAATTRKAHTRGLFVGAAPLCKAAVPLAGAGTGPSERLAAAAPIRAAPLRKAAVPLAGAGTGPSECLAAAAPLRKVAVPRTAEVSIGTHEEIQTTGTGVRAGVHTPSTSGVEEAKRKAALDLVARIRERVTELRTRVALP